MRDSDVAEYISEFENDSRVVGWFIADEPEQSTYDTIPDYEKDALIARYDYIKARSNKPVYVVFATP